MTIAKEVLLIFSLAAISLGLYYSFKKYVFVKYRIKKKYMLIAMIITITLSFVATFLNPKNTLIPEIFMIIFTIMFLLYLDISKMERIQKNKPVIGKPKPKPNRIKNNK